MRALAFDAWFLTTVAFVGVGLRLFDLADQVADQLLGFVLQLHGLRDQVM